MLPLRIERVTGDRTHASQFIARQFFNHYGAVLADDGHDLYAVIDRSGDLKAAFSLNRAPETFYCRHYIGDVREAVLGGFDRCGADPAIVELNHLALLQPRTLCQLNPVMVEFLNEQADFLVCTVIEPIADFFNRRAFAPLKLGEAHLDALPIGERHKWGRYYAHKPVVVAGDLAFARTVTTIAA